MAQRGGGFGFVMLCVVLVAALLLAARAWERSGAPALALDPGHASPATAPAHGPEDAREALRDLPDLGGMRDATSRHSEAVRDALAATEE